ncbi:MAG: PilZ domain-containing protein [Gammaproteobacteria bacterium]|nr:PilZ domain-containing protein [Gammaproteobacteria bacterium]MDH5591930.1 PilZ domain-containing protein [Gammaproteobacteria bacterium]
MTIENRKYIRHPSNIPLLFSLKNEVKRTRTKDVSEGGLCFFCQHAIDKGEIIRIAIPLSRLEFEADGIVCWCKQDGDGYLVGITFQEDSVAYSVRMIEQICHIEDYRLKVKTEKGVELTSEQAAQEWITQYAHTFPSISD